MPTDSHRPLTFETVVGQKKPIRQLKIHLSAHRKRGGDFQHVLLSGPAGNGKTTLAEILARELGLRFVRLIGPNITSVPDFRERLSSLTSNTVIFIDEVHSINRKCQELIYRLMEDGIVEIEEDLFGEKIKREIKVNNVVLVGATTNAGQLTSAMRTRFGIDLVLSPYTAEELFDIAKFAIADEWDDQAIQDVVAISRAIPRTIVSHIRLAEDYFLADERFDEGTLSHVDTQVVANMRDDKSLKPNGTTEQDWRYIMSLMQDFGNSPTGVDSLASTTGIDKETIITVIEPYLIELGIIQRTPTGRMVNMDKVAFTG